MRRDFSGIAVVVAVTAALLGACGSGSSSPSTTLATIPIATELPWTRAPEVPTSSTIATTTTTVVDYAKVPILVRFEPVSPDQQEIIDAMKVLIPIENEWANEPNIALERLRAFIVGPDLEALEKRRADRLAAGRFSVPGEVDRYVVRSVSRTSRETAEVGVCFVNDAISYRGREVSQTTVLVDDSIVSSERTYSLRLLPEGWRYEHVTELSTEIGQDTCAF